MAAGPWYAGGLRFECTRCGRCCGGAPGTVRVSDAEIEALARSLELPEHEFRALHTRRLRGGDLSLRERSNGDCVLYREGQGCSVYRDRPAQCRSYPFWKPILDSPERWAEEADECPGIGTGPRWREKRIRRILDGEEA